LAIAQGRLEPADIARELDRTDELISKASELATSANNAQAVELVQNAAAVQQRAREAYQNGFLEVARARTRAARSIVSKVMSMLLDPEERADRVEHELQGTDDLLAQAREWLGPSAPEMTRTLLEAALRQQSQAWELFRAGNHRPSLRMTHQVREMLTKIRLQVEEFDPARLEEAFRRTEEIVKGAMESSSAGSSRAMEMADKANQMLHRAVEFASNGRYMAARQHLTQAQRFAYRSMRITSGEPVDDFERLAEQYQTSLARLTERLGQAPNESAARLMQESQEHFRLASELYQAESESQERAFAELNLAMRLLTKARELLE